MYSVNTRDHFMIAHSFRGEVFGPAQRMHGATYIVDVEYRRPALDDDGIVVDIGRAGEVLRQVLAELNFRNLDEAAGVRRQEHDHRIPRPRDLRSHRGAPACRRTRAGAAGLESMRVVLHESHVAWAAYEVAAALSPDRHRARIPFHPSGRSGYPHRRLPLCAQPAGGAGPSRRVRAGPSTGGYVSVSRTRRRSRMPRRVLGGSPMRAWSSSTGWRFGAMPKRLRPMRARLRLVALVHHPLALETGLAAGRRRPPCGVGAGRARLRARGGRDQPGDGGRAAG